MKNLKPVKLSSILHKAVSDMRALNIIQIEIEDSELKYLKTVFEYCFMEG